MTKTNPETRSPENASSYPEDLLAFRDIILATGTLLDFGTLTNTLVDTVAELAACERVVLLITSDEDQTIRYSAHASGSPAVPAQEKLTLLTYAPESAALMTAWTAGEALTFPMQDDVLMASAAPLFDALGPGPVITVPLVRDQRLLGALLADNPSGASLSPDTARRIQAMAPAAAITLENAREYSRTVQKSAASMHELYILRQIDRELNDTIEPAHVFNMTLDWALRFTNANAAAIALYDQETDTLRPMLEYGYDIAAPDADDREVYGGISHRVARAGHPEVIPDVAMDKDYVRRASATRSQMCVPVLREDRVIAVIAVDSKRLNGFTDEHLDFVEKLATRAGVAIDNARLFDETKREREKLSNVINTTADVVIVCGMDDRIILINPAAFTALRLDSDQMYVGRPFEFVFAETPLLDAYRRGRASGSPTNAEVLLANNRTFQFNLTPQANVGWIIVMHDITPFKEMDRLKSELIATVSHDLKQPLSVMNGYTELLLMHRKLDDTGISFVDMVRKSIQNMRQLIDDLLDLAKIESGVRLELEPINVRTVLQECVGSLKPSIDTKSMTVTADVPETLPEIMADRNRLQQVFHNLIGNAVKYTPPEGWVRVAAETQEGSIRVVVQDNGLGISPEDQAHIFERFYRVRRPETDSIEGTGLGLAIVKSLIEAHNGQITLESKLGQGTSFIVTLPLHQPVTSPSAS